MVTHNIFEVKTLPDERRKVIVVTDGDRIAGKAVKIAAKKVGARFISLTTGNPTPINGTEVVKLIKKAPHDPVVIMVDDRGKCGMGQGEKIFKYVAKHPDIEVIGVVAVASNTLNEKGVKVDQSVTRDGKFVDVPVDKDGFPEMRGHQYLEGDTVDIIKELHIPVVIGTGDTGKMDRKDDVCKGAPVTTKALLEIMNRSGLHAGDNELRQ